MKSPTDIESKLTSQWHRSTLRVERLLSADSWPLEFPIGRPTAKEFESKAHAVHEHIRKWKAVGVGEVTWEPTKYRAGADAISIPTSWRIRTPSEWVTASADEKVEGEYRSLEYLVSNVNERYRELLIRNRTLWRGKDLDEILTTVRLASTLSPGDAKGRPLRLLAGLGVDTKFFERNTSLLTQLLDERYQGAASEQGLHAFLDAYDENDHWVLVAPLSENLLSFRRQRVTTRELTETNLPGSRVLVVENEKCLYLLPELPDTIAILGAGLDLKWLTSNVFDGKKIAYWGDMDTWGLLMLARSRQFRLDICPLLMSRSLFDLYSPNNAVPEPTVAQKDLPIGLNEEESCLYKHLLGLGKGRLEQEYIPEHEVKNALASWMHDSSI